MGETTSQAGQKSPVSSSSEPVETLERQVRVLSCLYGLTRLALEEPGLDAPALLFKAHALIRDSLNDSSTADISILFRNQYYGGHEKAEFHLCCEVPLVLHGSVEGRIAIVRAKNQICSEEHCEEELIQAAAHHLSIILERIFAVHEREELLLQLRHADRLATIGQLAAGVAHQLNEPLGNILGFAQLAKKIHYLPGQAAEDLDRIIDASLNAREVIRKLMLFARQMPAERVHVTLDKIVEDSLWFFESRCAKQRIELVRDLNNRDRSLLADETQLRQVLINLVVNSMQSMEEGGTLSVRTWEESDSVYLEVSDTGVGIAEEIQDQIFIPFFTTKEVDEGTGLGLAIVHGIVRSHGGDIEVVSTPDEGTSFRVRFPAAREMKMGDE